MRSPPSSEKRADGVIRIYSARAEYGELSNFAAYPIALGGKPWPTSEHYFQAHKFESARDQEEIRTASSPMLAAQRGRDRKRTL
jgi:N-glycosidase YbiA